MTWAEGMVAAAPLTLRAFPPACSEAVLSPCVLHPGVPAAFSPGNLSTSSSASSTLGSPDNDEYILSFETIDKMRRVSSYSSLNSLIGNLVAVVQQRRSSDAGERLASNQASGSFAAPRTTSRSWVRLGRGDEAPVEPTCLQKIAVILFHAAQQRPCLRI